MRYIGYIKPDDLYAMTPNEWENMVIGGRDAHLDQYELNLHNAVAQGTVQAGKKLTRLEKDIERKRYEIRGELEQYNRKKYIEKQRKKAIRQAQLRGAQKMMEQMNNI